MQQNISKFANPQHFIEMPDNIRIHYSHLVIDLDHRLTGSIDMGITSMLDPYLHVL